MNSIINSQDKLLINSFILSSQILLAFRRFCSSIPVPHSFNFPLSFFYSSAYSCVFFYSLSFYPSRTCILLFPFILSFILSSIVLFLLSFVSYLLSIHLLSLTYYSPVITYTFHTFLCHIYSLIHLLLKFSKFLCVF